MPLDHGGLKTHETRLRQDDDLYYKKEMRDYNNPNFGTNQNIGARECSRLQ